MRLSVRDQNCKEPGARVKSTQKILHESEFSIYHQRIEQRSQGVKLFRMIEAERIRKKKSVFPWKVGVGPLKVSVTSTHCSLWLNNM